MLCDVIAVKPEPVVSLREPEPVLEMLGDRQTTVVDMVEHPELHAAGPLQSGFGQPNGSRASRQQEQ